jgi:hypothetical protein
MKSLISCRDKQYIVKAQLYMYKPREFLSVVGEWVSSISRQSVYEGSRIISRTHRLPLTPKKYTWYSFVLEDESTTWS